MAGHSKWANIKHRKAAQDKKRSKIFTRIVKDITIAARDGGPDIAYNTALRLAVQNAKGANIPKDTIEKAIKKGSGADSANLIAVSYEAYGPGGVAIFVEATTDNLNRTVANLRAALNKYNGTLGTNGSLSFVLDTKAIFQIPVSDLEKVDKENLELELIEFGSEDFEWEEDYLQIVAAFEDFGSIQKGLEKLQLSASLSQVEKRPKSYANVPLETAIKVLKLIDKIEEDEDVSAVYHNLEWTEELLNELEK